MRIRTIFSALAQRLGGAWRPPRTTVTLVPNGTVPALPEHQGTGHAIKMGFVEQGSWLLPFCIALALTSSSGFLFANFQDFRLDADFNVKLAYFFGFCLEFGELIAVFSANDHYKRGNRSPFLVSFACLSLLALVSVIANIFYLDHTTPAMGNNNNAPIISWLVGFGGSSGREWLFVLRAIALHFLEVSCTFVFSKREITLAEATKMRKQEAQDKMEAAYQDATVKVTEEMSNAVTMGVSQVSGIIQASIAQAFERVRTENAALPLERPRLLSRDGDE